MTLMPLSSLRARLILLVLLASVPALGLTLYTHLERLRLATESVQDDTRRLLSLVASDHARLIEEAHRLIFMLAQRPEVRAQDTAACSAWLAEVLTLYSDYANFGAADAAGDTFCSALPFQRPVSAVHHSWFQRALETREFAIGDYQIGTVTRKATVNFGYPILDEVGRVRVVVFAVLELAGLNRVTAEAGLPDGAALVIIDRSGTVLARYPEPRKWVGRSLAGTAAGKAALARGEGMLEAAGEDGVVRLYAFTTLGRTREPGAYLVIGIPKAAAYAQINRLLARNLAVLGLVAVLAFTGAWVLGDRLILRRVRALVTATARLAAGDLGTRTGMAQDRDELGQLARAFDEMAAAQHERHAELRKSEARKGAILESALDCIITMDHEGRIVEFNPAAERTFGHTRLDVIGKSMAELIIPPALRERHHRGLAHYLATGEGPVLGKRVELTAMRADGTEFPVELAVTRIELEGPPIFTGYLRDITERKRAEEIRQHSLELEEQNRRAQEATRLKSEFLANMSHELRTPLNAIIGFAELMHDGKVGPVSTEHKEYLGDILTGARHLLQLINDVLDLSKVESGKMEFRPEPVDLARLVGEVRDILRTLAATKRIVVDTRVDPGLGRVVLDPSKLKQVLYNYLSNALKFTPDEGRVTVRVGPEGADAFRLEVEDTGIGVRPEDLGRLFAEFQQLDASTVKKHAGTGLGLALTKRLVEAQGGHVGVRSTPGRGSTFFAVLPRVASAVTSAATPGVGTRAAAVTPFGTPCLLVVEDDPKDRQWLVRTLSEAGYAVETAATGAEAVARCRQRAFDAISLDILLPDMTGREVLAAIRREGPNGSVPVIVVTVVAEREAAAGFVIHDYLVKPVQAAELLNSLERAGVAPDLTRSVLVVDDDPNALKLMELTLRQLGYRAICTSDGAAGLRAAADRPPAAVVLDLLMPGMDGFEFLQYFRRTATGRRTPVLVWTVKDLTANDRARLEGMAHRVVTKSQGGTTRLLEEIQAVVALARTPLTGNGTEELDAR